MTLIKICGITNEPDLIAAVEAGADFLGFIFHEKSPRAVTPERAAALTETLRSLDVQRIPLCVGVFVNPEPEAVAQVLAQCQLQAAQIHKADQAAMRAIHVRLQGACYPAIQPQSFSEATGMIAALTDSGADGSVDGPGIPFWLPQVLVDAYHPTLLGGTGQRADLELARRLADVFDRMMLAGGLTPENVAETIRTVRPWAVDVASGVEAAPGRKDRAKLHAFIQTVRAIDEVDEA